MFYLLRDDRSSNKCSFDCLFPIASSARVLGFLSQLGDVVEHRVRSHDFECNVYVQESTLLLHEYTRIKARPDLDVVSIKRVCFGWVERLGSNSFEPESSHHTVEEDFEENQMVTIGGVHLLNPLDRDLEL